jgi:hypothetical protein
MHTVGRNIKIDVMRFVVLEESVGSRMASATLHKRGRKWAQQTPTLD